MAAKYMDAWRKKKVHWRLWSFLDFYTAMIVHTFAAPYTWSATFDAPATLKPGLM
jgi:hypothetical protein